MRAMTHRRAALSLLAVLLVLFVPILARGHVLFAHDNRVEVGLPPAGGVRDFKNQTELDEAAAYTSNRKFFDQSSVYVPEIHQHLNGNSYGWISTWNPHPELGRPTSQMAGFGKAYLLTHLLSFVTSNAFVLHTWQVMLAVTLTTLLGYLLCAALRLRPEACLVGALGLGTGVFTLYWLTFALFVWTICWTLALLWLITLELERPSWTRLVGIAFALHALLLSGYHQQIVWSAWLVTGYVGWRLLRGRTTNRARLVAATRLLGAAFAGVLTVAPAYLDLALTAQRSTRLDAPETFFLEVLPEIHGWRDLLQFFALRFDAFVLGNPIEPRYPVRFNGLTMTPLFALLAATSLRPALVRRLWPAQLFVAFTLLMTVWPPLYVFGIRHLGLDISRNIPLSAAYVPGLLLAAYAVDDLLRTRDVRPTGAWIAAGIAAALAALACWVARGRLDTGFLWSETLVVVLALAALVARRPAFFVVLALVTTLHYGLRLPLSRPLDDVKTTSGLVELVRRETPGGTRYAWVNAGFGSILPPNQEALLGLRSIHTYNSLSSAAYQDWVLRLSPLGTQTYGRHFVTIPDESLLDGPELDYSGIRVVLAGAPLESKAFVKVADASNQGIVYRTKRTPQMEAQVVGFDRLQPGAATIAGPLRRAEQLEARRDEDYDDRLGFAVTPSDAETLLFISQQFHPQWEATADGRRLETVTINDFYQGVLVPPGTSEVRLAFRPWVRWMWLPQLAFVLAGATVLVAVVRARRAT